MSLEAQVSEAHGTGRAPKVGTDGGCGEKGPWATSLVKKRDPVSALLPALRGGVQVICWGPIPCL